jgi:hypothetical protein
MPNMTTTVVPSRSSKLSVSPAVAAHIDVNYPALKGRA